MKPRFPLKPWLKIGLRLKGLGLKAQGFGFAGSRNRAASSRELELKVQGSSDPVWIRAWVAGHPFSDVFFEVQPRSAIPAGNSVDRTSLAELLCVSRQVAELCGERADQDYILGRHFLDLILRIYLLS